MKPPQVERFFARIVFKYKGQDEYSDETIEYFYNRESLEELNIKRDSFDNSQFISVHDVFNFLGHQCKVVEINVKLDDRQNHMSGGEGVRLLSSTEPTDFNCQVVIFVERID